MGRDHLTLLHPDELALDEHESRSLFDAVRPLFESEGWQMRWATPTRWYVSHDSLAGLPTASLDRVIGRNPDLWMPDHPQARLIRRLQSEVQMLLYQHPLNDERQARGAWPVNSFWLSGCGARPPGDGAAGWRIHVLDAPRQALLREDIDAWVAAWQALDRGPLAAAWQALETGRPVQLTVCGERHALTLRAPDVQGTFWGHLGRVGRRFRDLAVGAPPLAPARWLSEL